MTIEGERLVIAVDRLFKCRRREIARERIHRKKIALKIGLVDFSEEKRQVH